MSKYCNLLVLLCFNIPYARSPSISYNMLSSSLSSHTHTPTHPHPPSLALASYILFFPNRLNYLHHLDLTGFWKMGLSFYGRSKPNSLLHLLRKTILWIKRNGVSSIHFGKQICWYEFLYYFVLLLSVSIFILFVFRGHLNDVYDLTWAPDSSAVASASTDRSVRIWKLSNAKGMPISLMFCSFTEFTHPINWMKHENDESKWNDEGQGLLVKKKKKQGR